MASTPAGKSKIWNKSSFSTTDTIKNIWINLNLPPDALQSLRLDDTTNRFYPSSFKIDHLAQSTIALSALSAALVHSLRTKQPVPPVSLSRKHASLEFKTERLYTLDGQPPSSTWGPIGGLHRTADGYVRIHDNFPNHRYGTLDLLDLDQEAGREDVAEKVRQWQRFELESAAAEKGVAIYALRNYDEWDATPQAAAVSDFPIRVHRIRSEGAVGFPLRMASAKPDRCLAGLRVLELSRVIAAPVAGKTLAAHGADVMWVTSPTLPDLPDLDRNLSRGKRTIQLDLNAPTDRERLASLVKDCDVFLQGYRPGSLAGKGFGPAELVKLRPGIIIANLSAFGPEGPWAGRRGFDSLVQTCSGMNVSEAEHFLSGSDEASRPPARPMPCQALDHAAGYLLATGVAAAVYKRALEGGSWEVDVSLAGVMEYLRSLGQWEGREGFDGAEGLPGAIDEVDDELVESRECGFGQLKALKHAAGVEGVRVSWDVIPKALGSDDPVWLQ